jgi:hypothetical protein
MRSRNVMIALVVVLPTGCASDDTGGARRGTPIAHVEADYGPPDVIGDRSGDQKRYYVPAHRPEEEWPADAPRTFYYLDRGLAVTFVSGKAVGAGPIDADLREGVLLPLVRRYGGSAK